MAVYLGNNDYAVLRELHESPRLFELLRDQSCSEFQLQETLRREFPHTLVRAALTLADLRKRALSKFARADEMWFDRIGLQQATMEGVARHKARRFQGDVLDLCCGIGGDTVAVAEVAKVCAVDSNPVACLNTKWNAEAYGVSERVSVVCAKAEDMLSGGRLVHIDPDRRAQQGRRALRLADYEPPLEFLQRLTEVFTGGAIKIGPASNFAGQFLDAEIELISMQGECKEATVWFGELASGALRRATVLPAGATLFGDPLASRADLLPVREYLYDPDAAVVRAGLVDLLAETLDVGRLDESEEILTSDRLLPSPFVRIFRVLAVLPNNERAIRRFFRDANFGQVEIKSRHLPVKVEALRRKLSLKGDEPGVLILTRVAGQACAIVAQRVRVEDNA